MRLAPRALTSAAFVLLLTIPAQMAAAQDPEEDFFPGACRDVDPMDAVAHGMSRPLLVLIDGEPGEPQLIETEDASATQVGPGKSGDRVHFINVSVPDEEDPLVTAQLLHGRVDLDVDGPEDGLESEAWVNTKLAHLNVADGLITADVVRAFAYARTDVRSARTYTDPSTIVNLKVAGLAVVDVSPGANITLPAALFGAGSYITVYERIDHSRMPTEDSPFYEADVRVRMINIHMTHVLGILGTVDVIVSESYARAVSPTPFCGLAQSVEAAAYTARVREGLESPGILVGEQHIGVTGGSGHQQLLGVDLDLLVGGDLSVNVTETDVEGEIVAGVSSDSYARSQIVGLCLRLDSSLPECFVEVVLVKAEATCHADANGANCTGDVEILKLVVDGVDVCAMLSDDTCNPPVDTVHDIGPIKVILNQQERVNEDGYASLYVRAIRIETPIPAVGTIIIGRAYASAGYENAGTNEETPAWNL